MRKGRRSATWGFRPDLPACSSATSPAFCARGSPRSARTVGSRICPSAR